jgi:PAS domain S-box-containing protein
MLALQDVLAASFFMILGTMGGWTLRLFLSRSAVSPTPQPEPLPSESPPSLADAAALAERLEHARMAETKAKSMFENLLANAHEGLILANESGVIERFNPEAQRMFGRRSLDVVGREVGTLFSSASAAKFDNYFNIATERDPGNSIVAVRFARARKMDGTDIELDLSISCVLTADSGLAFLISLRPAEQASMGNDQDRATSELRKVRRELKATRHRLNVARLDLAQLTHAVSHDLKSPVVNMMGFAEHLDHLAKRLTSNPALAKSKALVDLVEEEIPKTLDFMTRSGRKLCDRVEAFRELSRLNKLVFEPQEYDVRALLTVPLATQFGRDLPEGVAVEIDDDPTIEVDRVAVEYVLTELVRNAREHKHPERELALSIAANESRNYITLVLSDNGRGIPTACQEQVFQLFKVAYNADSQNLGRGLAYCTRLVDRLGGELSCRSEEDVGTTFFLKLPRRPIFAMQAAA